MSSQAMELGRRLYEAFERDFVGHAIVANVVKFGVETPIGGGYVEGVGAAVLRHWLPKVPRLPSTQRIARFTIRRHRKGCCA